MTHCVAFQHFGKSNVFTKFRKPSFFKNCEKVPFLEKALFIPHIKNYKNPPENHVLPCRIQYRQIFTFFGAPVSTFEITKKS